MAKGPVLVTLSLTAGGPTRLVLLLLCPLICGLSAQGQELPTNRGNGYSLHPPYFNLAEGTKITATATCGEGDNGRSIHDLYCKLVGGPVSGDPSHQSQTIQVRTWAIFYATCICYYRLIHWAQHLISTWINPSSPRKAGGPTASGGPQPKIIKYKNLEVGRPPPFPQIAYEQVIRLLPTCLELQEISCKNW